MPIDPFELLGVEPSPTLQKTLRGDLSAEFSKDPPPTTQACQETGCGGPEIQ